MIARNTLALVTASLAAGWAALILRARPTKAEKPTPRRSEENTYKLPLGKPLAKEMRAQYDLIARDVLSKLPKTGADLPSALPNIGQHADSIADALTPHLSGLWNQSGKRTTNRLSLEPQSWDVTSPQVTDAIRQQGLDFGRSTVATASETLHAVWDRLRADMTAGHVPPGSAQRELRARLTSAFDGMKAKADAYAITEASRARHAAQLLVAEASGIVAGFELLVSGGACSLCRKVATEARRIRIGEAFAVIGKNETYKTIKHPPIHIHCLCSFIEIVDPDVGGPEDVKWASTLQQPDKGLGKTYVPPKGMRVARPKPSVLKKRLVPSKTIGQLPTSRIVHTANKSRVFFEGMEVRAVRDLSRLSEGRLRAMVRIGFSGRNTKNVLLQLHHLKQNPAGPLVEIPETRHNVHNRIQHPSGNEKGSGLTAQQRDDFSKFRDRYWKARALEALERKGIIYETGHDQAT